MRYCLTTAGESRALNRRIFSFRRIRFVNATESNLGGEFRGFKGKIKNPIPRFCGNPNGLHPKNPPTV